MSYTIAIVLVNTSPETILDITNKRCSHYYLALYKEFISWIIQISNPKKKKKNGDFSA